ncbi:MAG: hypothetical protein WC556_08775 [Candidatus Methanoperedens sp.]
MRNPFAAHEHSPKRRPSLSLSTCFAVKIALNNPKHSRNRNVRQDNRMNRIFKQNRILSILFILSEEKGFSCEIWKSIIFLRPKFI